MWCSTHSNNFKRSEIQIVAVAFADFLEEQRLCKSNILSIHTATRE